MPNKVFSSIVGNNADLIYEVAKLYLRPGDRIADVTYGKGVFWRKIDTSKYEMFVSDLLTVPERLYDFRNLPYSDNYFDVVVLDPPYSHNPGYMIVDANYHNRETTKGFYHDDIIRLYRDGIIEAYRVLKPGGLLWVKCKDEIESGIQRMSHTDVRICAEDVGFFIQDFFVMVQSRRPVVQHHRQLHARKNHSYLWIFKKPTSAAEAKKHKKATVQYSIRHYCRGKAI